MDILEFNGRAIGCGGFVNITRTAKKVVFAGSFTAGGLKTAISNGELVIVQEGKTKKFVDLVEQVTFSGKYAAKAKQPLLYVTERCVFTLENEQMILIEIAPGVDLERDILAHMDFKPRISPQLKQMEKGIFQSQWGELRKCIEGHPKTKRAGA